MDKSVLKVCNSDCEIITVQCPECGTIKKLEIPKIRIDDSKPMKSISIREGLVCNHKFILFLDNNYKVRAYQKIDQEFSSKDLIPEK